MLRHHHNESDNGYWMSYREVISVPMHWHAFYEVELCIRGCGRQIINGVESPLNPGVLTLLSPRDFHRIEADSPNFEFFTFCFYEDAISSNVIKLLCDNELPYRIELEKDSYENVYTTFTELYGEINSADSFSVQSVRCRIGLICIDVIRRALAEREKAPAKTMQSSYKYDLQSIQAAINYVNEHYSERITRENVAAMLHLNPTYFSNLFKCKLGITFSQYVTDCRMAQAMHLIRFSSEMINSIMLAVGYNSSSLFYRKFEEYYHMSPSAARKLYGMDTDE